MAVDGNENGWYDYRDHVRVILCVLVEQSTISYAMACWPGSSGPRELENINFTE